MATCNGLDEGGGGGSNVLKIMPKSQDVYERYHDLHVKGTMDLADQSPVINTCVLI